MNVTYNTLDLSAHMERVPAPRPGILDDLPHDAINRAPGETWLVSHDAIRMDKPLNWFHYRQGEHVVIPLIPYVLSPQPEQALGYMLQLGMRCSFDLGRPVQRLHLSIGRPVIQFVGDPRLGDGWQYWLGFAVLL